jgi:glycosyltransferase involved in cell wall biosynthesis
MALLVPGGVDRSGVERVIPVLLALLARLSRHHEVHVFALAQEPRPAQWRLAGADIHNIGRRWNVWRALAAIFAEHRRGRFALVQSIWSGRCGMLALLAGRLLGLPTAVHVAGGEIVALPTIGYGGRLHWRGRLREAAILRLSHAVSSNSEPMLDRLRQLGVAARRIPLGVDLQSWPPVPPRARRAGERLRLIHVASINPVKDQSTLLYGLQLLQQRGVDFELTLVGEDTLGGLLQTLAGRLGLAERIEFRGFVPQAELYRLMQTMHLLVMSSRHEAGPVCLFEAALAGVPAVGTAVGHFVEWHPGAARAVPCEDPAALAAALCTLAQDDALRMALATAAQARALEDDADHTAARFAALHAALLADGTRECGSSPS